MKHPALHGLALRIVPFCAALLLRGWFATCRCHEHGQEHRRRALAEGKPVIAVFWHYSLAYLLYHMRDYRAAALVSASRDGDYLAALAGRFKFATVRGSRNRRGLRALMELLDHLRAGEHLAIVADGSQGPPLQAQGGPVMLGSKSGSLILPIAWSASAYFTFRSWDRTALPRPFSRIDLFYGEPLRVPDGLDADGIETHRQELERSLLALYGQAWSRYDKEGH
ncbi:lysophospholipid acyltransferase family protein [Desulfofustis limnaeus]|jgi:lysophospholipid acyltransferase (LPLAT)-like uncharacterized protein|uniref:DUF374 domain-containing protein n=1 Tax=Desulfofustis limnaeus TaxID=2740163 RepID=A0ABM7W9D1_9BACT|nr:lysophospholipid acyltransferase family protein [Desulfofustis limnaeus]MDX9894961.1 lysophospholipid acyltransferase family protein [Desulfofustis sp.]BDD87571.1 hypothetical protein DPPLL_19360 [Desulfofustis limnaeus]